MELLLLVALLVGLAVLMIFFGLARTVEPTEANRLEDYLNATGPLSSGAVHRRTGGGMSSSAGEMSQGFEKILRSIFIGDRIAYMLHSADVQMKVTEYLLVWVLCIGGGAALGWVISRSVPAAILMGFAGALLPYWYLRRRMTKRVRAFNNQLPNVLMQLSGSMRAGYGLLQAIDFVAREMPAPAGREFALVIRDVKLGRTTMAALTDMIDRVESEDLRLVITAMRIQSETGGNLAEILDTVSETIRERVRIKGELRALTSQQRMAGYVLAGLPIVVFLLLMLLNPTYEARLFSPGPTLCIPVCAMVSMITGFLIIRRIVAIEV